MKNSEERRKIAIELANSMPWSISPPDDDAILSRAKKFDRFMRTGKTPATESSNRAGMDAKTPEANPPQKKGGE